ncbi:MAG: hypothetical protein JKY95_05750 [Planctomycetaceae bacterium]|nr:hypothetical protein [Planctomycetaceae bacterium]
MDNETDNDQSAFRLSRPASPLPVEKDFGGCLDGQCAWRNFGGLSISQAYELFLTNPVYYEEAFMFMDTRAFEYYLPVIDRYLREVSSDEADPELSPSAIIDLRESMKELLNDPQFDSGGEWYNMMLDGGIDFCQVISLGSSIEFRLEYEGLIISPSVLIEIMELSGYIQSHASQYSPSEKVQRHIVKKWSEVDELVQDAINRNKSKQLGFGGVFLFVRTLISNFFKTKKEIGGSHG